MHAITLCSRVSELAVARSHHIWLPCCSLPSLPPLTTPPGVRPFVRAAPSSRVQRVFQRQQQVCEAAKIQFIKGVDEPTVPEVALRRNRNGTAGTAIFVFENPSIFQASSELGDITGVWWGGLGKGMGPAADGQHINRCERHLLCCVVTQKQQQQQQQHHYMWLSSKVPTCRLAPCALPLHSSLTL